MRLERLPYFADILQDTRGTAPAWHCIVQRQGSSEMLVWRQYESEDAAQQDALAEMEALLQRERERAGQLHLPMSQGKGTEVA
jgi:hypothetical protein